MNEYKNVIISLKNHDPQCDGALLIAVFRGTFSEGIIWIKKNKMTKGIDFTDNLCRAVLAVGLPLPNCNDELIKCKLEFNNSQ